jgi:hypothetical protein
MANNCCYLHKLSVFANAFFAKFIFLLKIKYIAKCQFLAKKQKSRGGPSAFSISDGFVILPQKGSQQKRLFLKSVLSPF